MQYTSVQTANNEVRQRFLNWTLHLAIFSPFLLFSPILFIPKIYLHELIFETIVLRHIIITL